MVTKSLLERLARIPIATPDEDAAMGAAPATRVSLVLTSEQDVAGKTKWDSYPSSGTGSADRRDIVRKAGFAGGYISEVARSAWEALPLRTRARIGPVLTPHLYSAEEVAGSKKEAPAAGAPPTAPLPVAEEPVTASPPGIYDCGPSCPPEIADQMRQMIPTAAPRYLPQVIAGSTDIDILTKAVAVHKNILLLGETGLGKTTALQYVAYVRGLPYASVNLNGGTTVEDFVGMWAPKESGGFAWRDGILTKFVRYGGLLAAEEVNAANPEIIFALHGLLDDNRQLLITAKGDEPPIKAHPMFVFAATMNPAGSGRYAGTQELNAAFQDRFHVVLEFTGQNIPKIIQDKNLVAAYERIHGVIATGEVEGILSTRGLKQFLENRAAFGLGVAREIFLQKFAPGPGRTTVGNFLDEVGLSGESGE